MSTQQNGKGHHGDVTDTEKGPLHKQKSTTSDGNISDTDEKYIPVPPDGGYGWVIMFGSFIANVLVDGVCFCVGIFIIEFLAEFGESKAKTSWVGSVLNGMYLSMGPITSALATKFGCRAVTIVGSLVACTGFVLTIFAKDVNTVIFTFGGIGGKLKKSTLCKIKNINCDSHNYINTRNVKIGLVFHAISATPSKFFFNTRVILDLMQTSCL